MPNQFEQVIGSFLTWFAYKELAMSATWQISPGTLMLVLSPDLYCFSCQTPRYSNVSVSMAWISNDTIDSVLRHREVGQAKDLSAPLHNYFTVQLLLRYCCTSNEITRPDEFCVA
jgi:hypothetical protein